MLKILCCCSVFVHVNNCWWFGVLWLTYIIPRYVVFSSIITKFVISIKIPINCREVDFSLERNVLFTFFFFKWVLNMCDSVLWSWLLAAEFYILISTVHDIKLLLKNGIYRAGTYSPAKQILIICPWILQLFEKA